MSNEILLLMNKFIEDNCECLSFARNDIDFWALNNMDPYYSSKFHLFLKGLRFVLNEKANKIFFFNWSKVKAFYKEDPKKYEELLAKHRKANKL